jgi:ribosomal protein S18 acetylase RimI-like enzyme
MTSHDRRSFSCGVPSLDRYFREQAGQDFRRHLAKCYVAVSHDQAVAGFYTLSATSLLISELPQGADKKLPYPLVPAALIGRLAVSQAHQQQGLGTALVIHAIRCTLEAGMAAFALVVDAENPSAARFYEHLGFQRLQTRAEPTGNPRSRLFLPISSRLCERVQGTLE